MADYLKIPEVARQLDVSEPTVRRMVKGGKLPSVFVGGAYRISETDLEEYLENARVIPGKAPAPSPPEPSFDDVLDEERRYHGSRIWERINLLERAADQWQLFLDEGLYDLEKLGLEGLKAVDAVSLNIIISHGPDAAGMKRTSTDEQRGRLEQAERRLVDTNLEFWARAERELARGAVTDLVAFRAQREQWDRVSRSSETA